MKIAMPFLISTIITIFATVFSLPLLKSAKRLGIN